MAWRETRRNLAPNPNFSRTIDGYTLVPIGNATNTSVARVLTRGVNNSASAALTAGAGGLKFVADPIRLASGSTYTASINVTGTARVSGSVRIRVTASGPGWSAEGDYVTVPATATAGALLHRPYVTFTVPAKKRATNITVELPDDSSHSTGSSYTINIDDVLIEHATSVGTYFDGDTNMGGADPTKHRNRWVGTPNGWNAVIEERYTYAVKPNSGYIIVGSFQTGRIKARSTLATGGTFELALNEPASFDFSGTLPWFESITGTTYNLPREAIPWRDFIGWVENDEIVFAGPITIDTHSFPAHAITAADPWAYFQRRYLLPQMGDNVEPQDVISEWKNQTVASIGKNIIQQATAWPDGDIPIDFAFENTVGSETARYPGEDMKPIGDALVDLAGRGTDFMFKPKWNAEHTHVRWELIAGQDLSPSGLTHYWDTSGPNPYATPMYNERSGEMLASHAYATGATYQNMISNPSFQEREGGKPTQWVAAGGTTIGYESSPQFDGPRTLTLSTTGLAAQLTTEDAIRILPKGLYSGQAWIKNLANTPPVRIGVNWYDEDDKAVASSASVWVEPPLVSNEWTMLHFGATAPTNAAYAKFVVQMQNTTPNNRIFVGGVMLAEGDTEPLRYVRDVGTVGARAYNTAILEAGYPMLEAYVADGEVTRAARAAEMADDRAIAGAFQLETLAFDVRRDKYPALGMVFPGDKARVNIGDNQRLSKEIHDYRIVRVRFSPGGPVRIETAPVQGTGGYKIPPSSRNWLKQRLHSIVSAVRKRSAAGFKAY
ncbi:MAG: hypothetical protein ACTH4Y_07965 [Microbacterium gubbeenense]|uniref:hypothetical protein n=1 Tax=Microbacterium gubbeenense TaxID=159896 RepID=UPI003F9C178F